MDIVLNQTIEKPIYSQIYSQISSQILNGTLQAGTQLSRAEPLTVEIKSMIITSLYLCF